MESVNVEARFNRGTGLLVLEVRHSNPNGDPDAESEPRTIETDGKGLVSPVSVKRKIRDLVSDKDGPVWQEAATALSIEADGHFGILELRGRKRDDIFKLDADSFSKMYWDARVFGNTFLESMKGKTASGDKEHFISTGVVQFGPGVSVAPVEIERMSMTSKAGVEEGKDRGMAPMGWRVVRHGVYIMPFFVNPMMAKKTGCTSTDIDLLKFVIPYTYSNTASAIRPFVEVRHAWYTEHQKPLGSCPDSLIIDALIPKKVNGASDEASTSIEDYEIPKELPADVVARLESFEDLCMKNWG
jgi:CRISPR-associated protein Csd2